MEQLPMLPGCELDGAGRREQWTRYRAAGKGARVLGRDSTRLTVAIADDVDAHVVEEAIAIEAGCCPSLAMTWREHERCLEVSVSGPEDAPTLGAIAAALGVEDGSAAR